MLWSDLLACKVDVCGKKINSAIIAVKCRSPYGMVFYSQQKSVQSSRKDAKVIFRIFSVLGIWTRRRENFFSDNVLVSFLLTQNKFHTFWELFFYVVHVFVYRVKCTCLTCFLPWTLPYRNQSIDFQCIWTDLIGTLNLLNSFIKRIKQRHPASNKISRKHLRRKLYKNEGIAGIIRIILNPLQPSVALYVETSYLICRVN